jgi:hypothetical protein
VERDFAVCRRSRCCLNVSGADLVLVRRGRKARGRRMGAPRVGMDTEPLAALLGIRPDLPMGGERVPAGSRRSANPACQGWAGGVLSHQRK